MNIVLIGYRGTGKSEVARALSELLSRPSVSTDAMIEERVGVRLGDYIEEHGWDAFRDIESTVVADAAAAQNAIIDTGGGAVLRSTNVDTLKRGGTLIWLRATPETIRSRIADDTNRPSLTGTQSFVDEVTQVLEERTPIYAAAADITIDTDSKTPEEIAGEILAELGAMDA